MKLALIVCLLAITSTNAFDFNKIINVEIDIVKCLHDLEICAPSIENLIVDIKNVSPSNIT